MSVFPICAELGLGVPREKANLQKEGGWPGGANRNPGRFGRRGDSPRGNVDTSTNCLALLCPYGSLALPLVHRLVVKTMVFSAQLGDAKEDQSGFPPSGAPPDAPPPPAAPTPPAPISPPPWAAP